MLIANPIYDTVFKYLLEDLDIARDLLSLILDKELTHISVKPQETVRDTTYLGQPVRVFRLDFKAIIRYKDGRTEKVIIELQKAKVPSDIMRFRGYLGDNYLKEDTFTDQHGNQVTAPLRITTIYFLGFPLEKVSVPVLKVDNCCLDVFSNKYLEVRPDEPFIRLLNHESYTIQIRLLEGHLQSRLERVLNVFSQEYKTEDKHQMNFNRETDDPLVQKMVGRLSRAVASEDVKQSMVVEDELERLYNQEMRGMQEKIVDQGKTIDEQDKALEQKDKTIALAVSAFHSAGKSTAEIANLLGISEQTVESLLSDSKI